MGCPLWVCPGPPYASVCSCGFPPSFHFFFFPHLTLLSFNFPSKHPQNNFPTNPFLMIRLCKCNLGQTLHSFRMFSLCLKLEIFTTVVFIIFLWKCEHRYIVCLWTDFFSSVLNSCISYMLIQFIAYVMNMYFSFFVFQWKSLDYSLFMLHQGRFLGERLLSFHQI